MKIQLSPKRIIPDAVTVWHEAGPDVDLVMDPKKLTFRENSIEAIFAFHILDHLFAHEIPIALANWYKCMEFKTGILFVTVNDFEFVARSFVGGDINIEQVNAEFTHPFQFTKDNLVAYVAGAGFDLNDVKIWYMDVPNLFKKEPYELVFSAEKLK